MHRKCDNDWNKTVIEERRGLNNCQLHNFLAI